MNTKSNFDFNKEWKVVRKHAVKTYGEKATQEILRAVLRESLANCDPEVRSIESLQLEVLLKVFRHLVDHTHENTFRVEYTRRRGSPKIQVKALQRVVCDGDLDSLSKNLSTNGQEYMLRTQRANGTRQNISITSAVRNTLKLPLRPTLPQATNSSQSSTNTCDTQQKTLIKRNQAIRENIGAINQFQAPRVDGGMAWEVVFPADMNATSCVEPYQERLQKLLGVRLEFRHGPSQLYIGGVIDPVRNELPELTKLIIWRKRWRAWDYFRLYAGDYFSGYTPDVMTFMIGHEYMALESSIAKSHIASAKSSI